MASQRVHALVEQPKRAWPIAGLQVLYPYLREERAQATMTSMNHTSATFIPTYKNITNSTLGPPDLKFPKLLLSISKVLFRFPSVIIASVALPPYQVLFSSPNSPFSQHPSNLKLSLPLIL